MILIIICAALAATTVSAQQVTLSNWNTISSLRTVRAADIDVSGDIWAATSGGVIRYSRSTNNTSEYRNVNALQTLDCTALSCDRVGGNVFVGQTDGALDIATPSGTWKNVAEIRRATQYTRRQINGFAFRGDTVFIATDFGVVLYNQNSGTFIETIDRIGTLQEKTRVRSVCLLRDSVWVATDSGVAVAPLSVSTLRLPSVWTNLGLASGLDAVKVTAIRTNGVSIVCNTDASAFEFVDGRFISRITGVGTINGLSYVGNQLAVSTIAGVRTTDGELPVTYAGEVIGHAWPVASSGSLLIVFIRDQAFGYGDAQNITMVAVNSPVSNQFAQVSIDTKGGLWVATDVDPPRTGQGVSYFDGITWRNITMANEPRLRSNSCYKVSSLSDGSTWVGTWGAGTIRCVPSDNGVTVEPYDNTNSTLTGITVNPNYVLVAEVARDRYGRTWLLNEQSADRLFAILGSGEWTSMTNCADPRSTIFRTLTIDGSGTVWAGGATGAGVLAYNDRGTADRSDDICNVVRTSNSQIPDNVVNVLRVDRSGALWIGTSKGLAVISVPSSLSNTSVPFVRRINALANTVITDIYVDALNYKWVATTGGAFVLNGDGTEVVATVTRANTPLLDDNLRTIAVDERTGLVYFGTTNGCSVAQSSSIRPLDEFNISCYPQPFRLEKDGHLTIDGLAPDADIRIMTSSGILVAAIQARGRQATWNGLDTNGRAVVPGVYIISSSSPTTNTSSVAKIAVTR